MATRHVGRSGDEQAELGRDVGGERRGSGDVRQCLVQVSRRADCVRTMPARFPVRGGARPKETTAARSGAFRSKVQSTSPAGCCNVAAITLGCACTAGENVAAAARVVVLQDRSRDPGHVVSRLDVVRHDVVSRNGELGHRIVSVTAATTASRSWPDSDMESQASRHLWRSRRMVVGGDGDSRGAEAASPWVSCGCSPVAQHGSGLRYHAGLGRR